MATVAGVARGHQRHRRRVAAAVTLVVTASLAVAVSPLGRAAATPVAATLVPVAPTRILDSRHGVGTTHVLAAGATVSLRVTGLDGVPSDGVSAVALNVTVTQPTASGNVIVYADGTSRPSTSNVNFVRGETVPNMVIAPVGADGSVDFVNSSPGTTQLVADLSGYYVTGAAQPGAYVAVAPTRLLDTRHGIGASATPVLAGQAVRLQVTGRSPVPASGVAAVVVNVTATQPAAAGNVIVYPDLGARPSTSNVNFVAGQTAANLVVAKLGSDGAIDLANSSPGKVHLVADVFGYVLSGTATADGTYVPVTPARLLDTRHAIGAHGPVPANGSVTLRVDQGSVPPSGVADVVLNVTVTQPTRAGNAVVYGAGAPQPGVSNLNFVAGQTVPNLVLAPVSIDGTVELSSVSPGTTQLVADIAGYVLGPPPPGVCTGLDNGTGLSSSSIDIGNAADISGPVPGLYASAQQAVAAYAAYSNASAPVCGRSLHVDDYDSQTNSAADLAATVSACGADVALVGSASAFDDGGATEEGSCGMPDVRAEPLTLARQDAPNTVAAAYGDLDQVTAAVPDMLAAVNPTAAAHAALLYLDAGSYSVQGQADIRGWMHEGFSFVYASGIPVTEANYTPYVSAMQQQHVQYVQFDGPSQEAVRLAEAMQAQAFTPMFVLDTNSYNPGFVSSGGTAVTGAYVYTNASLFGEAAGNPELQRYEQWLQLTSPGAVPSTIGMYAWSAAALFTETARALGGNLTRANLLRALDGVHSWTGSGLYSPQDPAGKITSHCAALIQLNSSGDWVRRSPEPYTCGAVVSVPTS